jgi:hypothetical protein
VVNLSGQIHRFWISLIVCGGLWGQNFVSDVSKVGTTAGTILDMPVNARGLALGNAVAGLSDDGAVFFWNPASAAKVDQLILSATYIPWLVDTRLQHFAVVAPAPGRLVVGVYVTTWSMDDMPVRTELEQYGTGEFFNAGDIVVALSVARALTDRFSIGVNAKYIQERIWHSVARGAALDFGTAFHLEHFHNLRLLAVLSNYGTDMRMNGRDLGVVVDPDPNAEGNNSNIPADYALDAWSLPLNFRFGLALDLIRSRFFSLTLETDALHPSNNYESVDVGLEMTLGKVLFLRTGYSSLFQKDSIEGLSLGAGVRVPMGNGTLVIDYGYRDFGHLGFLQAVTANIHL